MARSTKVLAAAFAVYVLATLAAIAFGPQTQPVRGVPHVPWRESDGTEVLIDPPRAWVNMTDGWELICDMDAGQFQFTDGGGWSAVGCHAQHVRRITREELCERRYDGLMCEDAGTGEPPWWGYGY